MMERKDDWTKGQLHEGIEERKGEEGRWEEEKTRRWEDGKMRKREDGKMGR
jgi:hypothetical protein